MKYKYYLPEEGEGPEEAVEFESPYKPGGKPWYIEWIAVNAAENFYDENGSTGEDGEWPKVFAILDENDMPLGQVTVDIDREPSFYGHFLKEDNNV